MRDASGQQPKAFEFLPCQCFFLAPPQIGDVNARADNPVNVTFGIAEGNQICVEEFSSGGEVELTVIIHSFASGEGLPIGRHELLREFWSKHLLDEFSCYLFIGKTNGLLLGSI